MAIMDTDYSTNKLVKDYTDIMGNIKYHIVTLCDFGSNLLNIAMTTTCQNA